jgi:hypothetical protein
VLAEALKTNTSVTSINLDGNPIDVKGASALADALKVNMLVTRISLLDSGIGPNAASAFADALKVNTSVTSIVLGHNAIDAASVAVVDELLARNKRLRCLLLYDARKMLLSVLCADECGVVWPYLLGGGDTDGIVAPDNLNEVRAEFAAVVAERATRRCERHDRRPHRTSSAAADVVIERQGAAGGDLSDADDRPANYERRRTADE